MRPRRRGRPAASRRISGEGCEQFRALPQRLEWFAVIEGRRILQRFDGHHARVDHRRPAVAGRADLALGRREEQGGRFRAAWPRKSFVAPEGPRFSAPPATNFALGWRIDRRIPLRGRRDDGAGAAMVLAPLPAGRCHRSLARLREHRPVPQLPRARRAVRGVDPAVVQSAPSVDFVGRISIRPTMGRARVPIDRNRRRAIEGVCRVRLSGCTSVTTSGSTTVWASLAEADTALGVVASGFFLRGRPGIIRRWRNIP